MWWRTGPSNPYSVCLTERRGFIATALCGLLCMELITRRAFASLMPIHSTTDPSALLWQTAALQHEPYNIDIPKASAHAARDHPGPSLPCASTWASTTTDQVNQCSMSIIFPPLTFPHCRISRSTHRVELQTAVEQRPGVACSRARPSLRPPCRCQRDHV